MAGIAGIVCELDESFQSFETCIKGHESRDACRNCHFPTFALKIARDNDKKRTGAGYSATTLLNCPRAVALLSQYDYYEPAEALWNKIRGELLHAAAEADPDPPAHVVRERRVRHTLEIDGEPVPLVVTGKADEIDMSFEIITDYKFVGSIPEDGTPYHEAQFNIYAWLCSVGHFVDTGEPVNLTIKGGGMHYLTLKRRKKRDGTIIKPWLKYRYPIWSNERVEQLVIERLMPQVQFHQTGVLPTCDPFVKGRWDCECVKITRQLTNRGIEVQEDHVL
jgi:hypothetical protein